MSGEIRPNEIGNTLALPAIRCLETMKLLQKENYDNIKLWLLPYHILASTCLELYAKLKLFRRGVGNNRDVLELLDELKNLGHELHKLYSKKVLGQQFLSFAGIKNVENYKKKNEIYRYDFLLDKDAGTVHLFNPESIKYWRFSKTRPNRIVTGHQTEEILALCENVQEAAFNSGI